MFEKLQTSEEAFNYQLGAALKMEHTVLEKILEDSIDEAHDAALKEMLRQHSEETRQHIVNVERAFSACGWEIDESPSMTTEAIHKEGKSLVKKSEDAVVDAAIVSGATETEHHEIATYETLITSAEAMGRSDVVALLRENLEQEQRTLEAVKRYGASIAAASAGVR